jgi:hypothetical protein
MDIMTMKGIVTKAVAVVALPEVARARAEENHLIDSGDCTTHCCEKMIQFAANTSKQQINSLDYHRRHNNL